MTDLEKHIIDRLNAYLNPYNLFLKIKDDKIIFYCYHIDFCYHTNVCSWPNVHEMIRDRDTIRLSIFNLISSDFNTNIELVNLIQFLKSDSLEELQIKLDLLGSLK